MVPIMSEPEYLVLNPLLFGFTKLFLPVFEPISCDIYYVQQEQPRKTYWKIKDTTNLNDYGIKLNKEYNNIKS